MHLSLISALAASSQMINTSILAASQHRAMEDDPVSQSQFLEHFVPPGPTDLGISLSHLSSPTVVQSSSPNPSRADGFQARGPHPAASTPLPATFAEICQIQTSTVHPLPALCTASSPGISGGGKVGSDWDNLDISSSGFLPRASRLLQAQGIASNNKNHPSSWIAPGCYPTAFDMGQIGRVSPQAFYQGMEAKPTRVDPSAFSGNMSACLGDMMDALTRGNQSVWDGRHAGGSGSTFRSHSSLSGDRCSSSTRCSANRCQSSMSISHGDNSVSGTTLGERPHSKASSFGGSIAHGRMWGSSMADGVGVGVIPSARSLHPVPPLNGSDGRSGPTSRFIPTLGRLELQGGTTSNCTLGSPALLSKTKLQPIMSVEVNFS